MTTQPQVERALYFSEAGYATPFRFATYGHQVAEILRLRPRNVLEIGVGNGVVSHFLDRGGMEVTTVDFDRTLKPDVLASVTDLPLADSTFDLVGCFEVLEHLPFDMFPHALEQIHRVCRRHALISLPDAAPFLRVHIPRLLPNKLYERPFCRRVKHEFDGQHYWELNKEGFPLKKIVECMVQAGFEIEQTWRLWEAPIIRFFRLRKCM